MPHSTCSRTTSATARAQRLADRPFRRRTARNISPSSRRAAGAAAAGCRYAWSGCGRYFAAAACLLFRLLRACIPRLSRSSRQYLELERGDNMATPQSCLVWYGKSVGHGRHLENASTMDRGRVACQPRHDNCRTGVGATAAAIGSSLPSSATSQTRRRLPPPPAKSTRSRKGKPTPAFEHDPDLDAQDQFAPSQVQQQMPDAVAMPSGGGGGGHARAAARWH